MKTPTWVPYTMIAMLVAALALQNIRITVLEKQHAHFLRMEKAQSELNVLQAEKLNDLDKSAEYQHKVNQVFNRCFGLIAFRFKKGELQ